jgi:hypothetical protein
MTVRDHVELGERTYRAWTFAVCAQEILQFSIDATTDIDAYVMRADDFNRWKISKQVPYEFHKRGYIITDWVTAQIDSRWCLVVYNPRAQMVVVNATIKIEGG